MVTWVGYTNTFLASIASLLTAVATLVYVIRSKKATVQTQQAVKDIQTTIENGNGTQPITKVTE